METRLKHPQTSYQDTYESWLGMSRISSSNIMPETRIQLWLTEKKESNIIDFENFKKAIELQVRAEIEKEFNNKFDSIQKDLQKLRNSNVNQIRVLKIKDIDFKIAKDKINELVHQHKDGIDTLNIAERLELDPLVVLKALNELKDEGKIDKAN